MKSYSQKKEDLIIFDYFKGKKGTLLSIGENDGTTFSNARLLIEKGWSAYLIEPASVFSSLKKLHKNSKVVYCFNIGIGNESKKITFYESENHVPNGKDRALVSSCDYQDTLKWREKGVVFNEKEIEILTFNEFHKSQGFPKFDFITIDCESYDYDILKQMDLKELGCKAIIVEWNSEADLKEKFNSYISKFGLKLIHQNAENLIFAL